MFEKSVEESRDFFISFNRADRDWAKWIAYFVEEHGYSVYFQDWDFRGNFVEHMDRAHRTCRRTIALLSDHYFGSEFTVGEWTARYAQDPAAREDRIVAVRVGPLTDAGLLGPIQYADLMDCDESEAAQRLLDRIRRAIDPNFRAKPSSRPAFPHRRLPVPSVKKPGFPSNDTNHSVQANIAPDFSPDTNSRFAESIRSRMAELNRAIEELTTDQFRVLNQLRFLNRVRVCGCAGSGKTLVATEKAIRLARGGVKALLLCHNPILAEHIKTLVLGSDVDVASFQEFVARFASYGMEGGTRWTHYEEPDTETLHKAFDEMIHAGVAYGAIIVDEAQDFRQEWWSILEAALDDPQRSILYIFHDDHQALLPFRARYPVEQPVIDLSRNCRNAAEIYQVLRVFHRQSPEPEIRLQQHGTVIIYSFENGEELATTTRAFNSIYQISDGADIVALIGGPWQLDKSPFTKLRVPLRSTEPWQDSVSRYILDASFYHPLKGQTVPQHSGRWLRTQLSDLSRAPHPRASDITRVSTIVRQFHIPVKLRRYAASLSWIEDAGKLQLQRNILPLVPTSYDVLVFFSRDAWADTLPKPRYVQFTRDRALVTKDQIHITDVASFKGLEADCAILLFSDYTSAFMPELYVALSRARSIAVLLIKKDRLHLLPAGLRQLADVYIDPLDTHDSIRSF